MAFMNAIDRYRDPARPVRRWITVGLLGGGALAGAACGLGLTVLGKIVAGAPPADLANYVWNASLFGVFGACMGPVVTWAALRHVPLWRTIAEPLAGALVGAGIGTLVGSGVLFLLLAPIGAGAAVLRLGYQSRGRTLPPAES